ncbi:serine/arginine repetitive matrix protein 1-like [Planococcus citri]|uniref:serine/arginine repetitive matrix protein 1-like n=1 Tax=Planococcus citri TaxID=170843 RepID=UPI0031F7B69C
MSSGEDRRRSSIHDEKAYYQNVHSSSRRRKEEHRSRSEIRRNDEIRRYAREIKNLKQKIERLEMNRSPNRSRRSQYSRRERRSPKHSSSRESSQSQNRDQFEASKSSNRSCGSQYSRKKTSVSKRTSTDRTRDRRRRSPSHPSSRSSSQSQDSSYSHEHREQFKTSKSLYRSCGSQYSRKETSVSKRTSTDPTYKRRTRSRSRSSSRESNQSQHRSHSHKPREQFEASKSLSRSCGSRYSRKETSVSKRKSPSPPAHRERPRIQSDKAASNSKSRHLESPGIVDKEQNRYESKARLDPGKLTADPDNKSSTSTKATPSKKPDQNERLESVDLQKFPYDEFEFIGDSLSHYLANAVRKTTAHVIKPYLKEQISLTDLYKSIKPVTFTKSKAIVSMAQFELNLTDTYYKTVQKKVKEVIDLLIGKGFDKIIILFPVIKPVVENQEPVSMSSYFMYRQAFELVCDYKRVALWWTPAALFLQLTKDERCPGKMTFDQDEDDNMIPIKCKFHHDKISGKFYPDRDRKHEVLVEIDKLYRSAYFSGKRPEMDFVEE